MQLSGLPPDLYSFLQFFCIAFLFLSLGLIFLFNRSDSKNFFHDVNLNGLVDDATYHANDNDDDEIQMRCVRDQQIISVTTRRIRDRCGVCGNSSNSRCSRCKLVRYCSRACQIKHWREGHRLECEELKSLGKVDSAPTSSSRRTPGHVGISYYEYQQPTKDEALAEAKRSSKRTSGKEFQTVEECPICISIIRNSKRRPSLACGTCKHKFHSACITKWFSTSKKSNCPLCGSLFRSGGGLQQISVKKP